MAMLGMTMMDKAMVAQVLLIVIVVEVAMYSWVLLAGVMGLMMDGGTLTLILLGIIVTEDDGLDSAINSEG